ncbi:uncharacterized protein LOC143215456 [Lasioglossum baleicum]|uniref:uncharacterized protein LOC143215456 n=1 Tax=Lasioglossum baleicum TaxID=434251 RepID=UPI003FCDAC8D
MKEDAKKQKKKTDEDEEAPDVDKLPEEASLLETLDPRVCTIFATCFIDVQMKDGLRRDELLFLKLVCPVTRPEIVILNKDPDVSFGPTAIGVSSRRILQIKNISTKSVRVNVSFLDPYGSFFAPPGRVIETGSILNLPITYRPSQNREEDEFFEVSSSRTRTRLRIKLSGRGVVPSYVLKPRFGVARLEITDDKPVEIKISVENTGKCPLIFRFRIKDILEGNIPVSRDESPRENRKKGKSDGKSLGKSPKNMKLDDVLEPHEQLLIFEEGGLARSEHPECFSFSNLDEDMRLLVPEGGKKVLAAALGKSTVYFHVTQMEFGMIFQKPRIQLSEKEKSDEKSTRKKKKGKENKKKDTERLNYCYVALVELTLGGSVHVQDFIIICSLK